MGHHHRLIDFGDEKPVTFLLRKGGCGSLQEESLSGNRFNDALSFELRVGLGDGITVDAKFLSEGAEGGKGVPLPETARSSGVADLIGQLKVNWLSGLKIDLEDHGDYCPMTLGQWNKSVNRLFLPASGSWFVQCEHPPGLRRLAIAHDAVGRFNGGMDRSFFQRHLVAAIAVFFAACSAFGDSAGLRGLAQPHEGRSQRSSSTHRAGPDGRYDAAARPKGDLEEASNWDNQNLAPGATRVLLDAAGPGVITHIWMTFLGPEPQGWARQGSANHQEMLLRIYWDGRKIPGVEAPVGDFFANAFGKRSEVISEPVVVEDADSYNCFWQMPFAKSARVEIVNQGNKPVSLLYYNIDWIKKKELSKGTPYFHAQYRQEYPTVRGKDYVVLETQGKGHYVGTVLSVRTRSPGWFGEGDEKIYIDNEARPSIWGTGTEDFFLSAWGLKRTSTPYFGVPYFDQWGIVGGHTSAYRWQIHDPFVFNTGIKVTFEHFGWISPDENPNGKTTSWNEREDDYSSVAFWYQTGEPTFAARAPGATDRQLPSLERTTIFARDYSGAGYHGEGDVASQQLALYPGPQLLYKPARMEGAWVEIPFTVTNREPLRLLLNATESYDFGRYQAYLDGIKLGDVLDYYSDKIQGTESHLLDFWPEPGPHKLRLECVGKNSKSEGFYLGLESIRLRERRPRVSDYGFDREKNWKEKPVLYN